MSESQSESLAIGIRLGFTTASVAVLRDGAPDALPNPNGERVTLCTLAGKTSVGSFSLTESRVGRTAPTTASALKPRADVLIGEAAQRRALAFPGAAITHAPRRVFFHSPPAAPQLGGDRTLLSGKQRMALSDDAEGHLMLLAHIFYALLSDVRRAHATQWRSLRKHVVVTVHVTAQYFLDICELAACRAIRWVDDDAAAAVQQFQQRGGSDVLAAAWEDSPGAKDRTEKSFDWGLSITLSADALLATVAWSPQLASSSTIAIVRVGATSHTVTIGRIDPASPIGFASVASCSNFQVGSASVDEAIVNHIWEHNRESLFGGETLRPKERRKMLVQAAVAKHLVCNKVETDVEFDAGGAHHAVRLDFVTFTNLCAAVASSVVDTLLGALRAAQMATVDALAVFGGGAKLPLLVGQLQAAVPGAIVIEHPRPQLAAAEGAVTLATVSASLPLHLSLLPPPRVANSSELLPGEMPQSTTNFALLVRLHGGTFGVLLAPGQQYPARASRELNLSFHRGSHALHLVATKPDFATPLVDIGCCVVTPAALGASDENQLPISATLYCEVSVDGTLHVRISSSCASGHGQVLFIHGPFVALAADVL